MSSFSEALKGERKKQLKITVVNQVYYGILRYLSLNFLNNSHRITYPTKNLTFNSYNFNMTNFDEFVALDQAVNPKAPQDTAEMIVGDVELAKFVVEWSKNGFNATKAYLSLHPDVSEHSASVLGCRKLRKVSNSVLLPLYGIDITMFFNHLKKGLEAIIPDKATGEMIPDHKSRLEYLKIAGKLLDLPI